MLWGCFSAKGPGRLICVKERMNGAVRIGQRRMNPLAASLIERGGQANIKQRYRGQHRQGGFVNRGRAMGQGRRQTERITSKQAGSERQAANDQERASTVQVVHRKTH